MTIGMAFDIIPLSARCWQRTGSDDMINGNDRNEAISAIKAALKARSGRTWSVTGGTGTAWGWITITAQPKQRNEYGCMSQADCAALAALMGLGHVHDQGISIPASSAYRIEHVQRAQGRTPDTFGTQYWD